MTLNQLEYFQKVATLQHFRQAAEVLKISQPSLSRSMSLLEEELGLMLFEHQGTQCCPHQIRPRLPGTCQPDPRGGTYCRA